MIHITCPKCSKAYNLGDDKAGRTFRCQQCQGPVKVPAELPRDDPFAPDWEDEIPEAKPYGVADIPAAIPMARSRGKSRSRSSGGGSGVWIGLVAGVVLFAIAAGVIFVVLRERNPQAKGEPVASDPDVEEPVRTQGIATAPETGTSIAADYLPADASLVISMQGQVIWRDIVFRSMFGADHGDNTFAGMTLNHLGFHPDELIRIVMAVQPDDFFTPAGTRWIAAIDLRDPIDWGARAHLQFAPRVVGTETIHELTDLFEHDFAAWQPHGKVLVYGDAALIEQCITRGERPGPHVLLDKIAQSAMFGIAGDLTTCDWLRALAERWGVDPIESLDAEYIAFTHSFVFNRQASSYGWSCDIDLYGSRVLKEQELRPLVDRAVAFLRLDAARATVTMQPGPERSRVVVSTPGFPVVVLEFLSQHLATLKSGAYQVAGMAPPTPISGIVLESITATNPNAVRNSPPRTTPSANPAAPVDAVRPPPLVLDLDRMQTAAAGDLAAFIELFYPPSEAATLTGSRKQTEVDRLQALPADREAGDFMQALSYATPAFSRDGREASFRISLDIDWGEVPPPGDLPGFIGDLETTIRSAIAALDAADYRGFALAMMPAGEVNRLVDDLQAMADLNTRLQVYPAMVEAMKAELQECLDVGLTQGETIAEAILTKGRRNPRVVRFELVDGHWRFMDPGPPPAADAEAEFETVTLVHDGQVWRLKELPECLER